MNLLALTSSQGTILTFILIVLIVIVFGVIIITDDTDWFD